MHISHNHISFKMRGIRHTGSYEHSGSDLSKEGKQCLSIAKSVTDIILSPFVVLKLSKPSTMLTKVISMKRSASIVFHDFRLSPSRGSSQQWRSIDVRPFMPVDVDCHYSMCKHQSSSMDFNGKSWGITETRCGSGNITRNCLINRCLADRF